MNYVAPTFESRSFTCPLCGVYAQFSWRGTFERFSGSFRDTNVHLSTCQHCLKTLVWMETDSEAKMLWPSSVSNAALPHADMPEDVQPIYEEARSICNDSPRGAAALLRLAIQKLCKHLGETGENINADIGALVQKGLPKRVQQALDVVRVTGNNAVHPGEMQLEDSPEIVQSLFGLINLIVENRIAEPKRIEDLFQSLPEGSRAAIGRRDG